MSNENVNINKRNRNKTGKHGLVCKEIKRSNLLVDYASAPGELSPEKVLELEMHLDACKTCSQEYKLMLRLNEESAHLDAECSRVMAGIDWEKNAELISSSIPFASPAAQVSRRWGGFSPAFNLKLATAALSLMLFIGIGIGYLLFRQPSNPQVPVMVRKGAEVDTSLAQLENTLAKREVRQYFQQSQLVLTDLMGQCSPDGSFAWKNQLDIRQVRALLSKSRYFKRNLDNPDLLGSKQLLKKIEWLLYELLMNSDDTSCQKLERLQEYIKEERLLFKIRLIGKELSPSEV
jgi:hypothetical protein